MEQIQVTRQKAHGGTISITLTFVFASCTRSDISKLRIAALVAQYPGTIGFGVMPRLEETGMRKEGRPSA